MLSMYNMVLDFTGGNHYVIFRFNALAFVVKSRIGSTCLGEMDHRFESQRFVNFLMEKLWLILNNQFERCFIFYTY